MLQPLTRSSDPAIIVKEHSVFHGHISTLMKRAASLFMLITHKSDNLVNSVRPHINSVEEDNMLFTLLPLQEAS